MWLLDFWSRVRCLGVSSVSREEVKFLPYEFSGPRVEFGCGAKCGIMLPDERLGGLVTNLGEMVSSWLAFLFVCF